MQDLDPNTTALVLIDLAENATTGQSAEMHRFSVENILPRISRISKAADIGFKK
jgi:hypothetical protein